MSMEEAKRVVVSTIQHRQIIAALRERGMDQAVAALKENWRVTLDATGSWFAQKSKEISTTQESVLTSL
jgi:DNA-binding GntR family transcriptional regulator